jgi:thioredoxin 1
MNDKVRELTAEGWDKDVLESKGPVLVDLWAQWCPPCRKMGPVVERLALVAGENVTVGKLDVDRHPEVAERYGVRSIPTFLLFRNGQVVERLVGARPFEELLSLVAGQQEEMAAG